MGGGIANKPTTSRRDTGALSDSAISCAFSLMLAFLVLTVLIASLKLFCRFGLVPNLPFAAQDVQLLSDDSFRWGHRSLECSPGGRPFGSGLGLGPRDTSLGSSSSNSTADSALKSGNLNFAGVGLMEEERRSTVVVACGTIAQNIGHAGRLSLHRGRCVCRSVRRTVGLPATDE